MFMKKIGIICEYNPFHNGHIYHLQKIKEMFPDSMIILVMSGEFTMRGEISLLNKWDKTKIALKYGVSLVIELPIIYAVNSSDMFAEGSIKILELLKCDYVVFGSESNDIESLIKITKTMINNHDFDTLVKEHLDNGHNYPTSLSYALKKIIHKDVSNPNDLLAISYIKQIIINNYHIKPISIKRTNNYHDKEITNNITSATSIREALKNHYDISSNVPSETNELIIKEDITSNYFKLLKYQIINNINNLNEFMDVTEGIDNLIKNNILKAKSLDELINLTKTKRYTYNRLNRIFIHILLNIKKKDINQLKMINYIRILGFDNIGRIYLRKIKKETNIPLITKYSDIKNSNLSFQRYVSSIYYMIINKEELNIIENKSIPIKKED